MSTVRPLAAAAGLLLIVGLGAPARAHATALTSSSFTLDGTAVTVSSDFMPAPKFTVAKPGAVDQTAVSSTVDPYRDLMLEAMPFGTRSPGEGLPVATSGEAPNYRDTLRTQRHAEGATPQAAPAVDLFGSATPGTISQVSLPVTASGKVPVVVAEWVAQAGSRLWILRADEQLTGGATAASFGAILAGISVTAAGVNATPDPSPSSSPSSAPSSPQPSPSTGVLPAPITTPGTDSSSSAPAPATAQGAAYHLPLMPGATGTDAPWWNGTCDVGNNGDGYPLGTVFQGFAACGPRPYTESPASSQDYLVRFYPGAWGEYEFECVELAMRYMYLTYGIAPYQANGNQVVTNYPGSSLTKVANGTLGQAPHPGDILSFGADTAAGHAAVVTGSSVSSSGNGTVTVIEENNSASGANTLTVSGWVVGPDAYPTIGWLTPTSAPLSVTTGTPVGSQAVTDGSDIFMFGRSATGTAQIIGFSPTTGWGTWAGLGGGIVGEPRVVVFPNGQMNVFAIQSDGSLGEIDYAPWMGWTGWYRHGGTITSEPAVVIANGNQYVYVRGPDGQLWVMGWSPASGWGTWAPMGDSFDGDPAAMLVGQTTDLFVRTPSGGVDEREYSLAQGWSGWTGHGGAIASDPAPVYANGDRYVYARGTDASLHVIGATPTSGWGTWVSQGGSMNNDPATLVLGESTSVFVTAQNAGLYEDQYTPSSGWTGWIGRGGAIQGDPVPLIWGSAEQVFVHASDGTLWVIGWTATSGWGSWVQVGGPFS